MSGSGEGRPDAVVYAQLVTQFLNMNDTLYKIPPIFSTVVGGLWFFAMQHADDRPLIGAGVFLFAAAVGYTGQRLTDRIDPRLTSYMETIRAFEKPVVTSWDDPANPGTKLTIPDRAEPPFTAEIMARLMKAACGLSLAGAAFLIGLFFMPGLRHAAPPTCALYAVHPAP